MKTILLIACLALLVTACTEPQPVKSEATLRYEQDSIQIMNEHAQTMEAIKGTEDSLKAEVLLHSSNAAYLLDSCATVTQP